MREMLAFEKICNEKQNLKSIEDKEGIFILDEQGKIVFANKKAKEIYRIRGEIRKLLGKKKVVVRRGNKEIIIYPIMDGNELRFHFGIIRSLDEIIKMKEYVNFAHQKVKLFKQNIAHYFFNPIIIAKGYLDLLMDKKLSPEDKIKVEKIKTAIERIEAVVRNIVINGEICE